jgi:signal transduction histidine kinase
MSHEMKVPLTVIATGIDYADRQIKKEGGSLLEAGDALETVREETQRLGRMVGSMVNLAAINEKGDSRKRVDFSGLLRDSCEAFRYALEQKNNRLALDIAPGLPDVFVEGDSFTQVIVNLMSNAGEHTRDGRITLTANFDNEYVTVRVADTGEGIPPELMPRVFERGISGRGSTGYGLYISKIIVEAHGGTIRIEGEPGKGASATFTVPVYGGQEAGHIQ